MGDARKIVVNFYEESYDGIQGEATGYTKSVDVSPSPDELITTNVTFDKICRSISYWKCFFRTASAKT